MENEQNEQVIYEGRPSWRAILGFYIMGLVEAVVAGAIAYLVSGAGLGAAGRARATVEQKRHRPAGAIGAVELVGGVGDIGLRLALVVEQPDRACGGGEVERAAGQRQRLPGGGIRRQAMLFGHRRRGGAPACPTLLARWRR